MCIRDSLSSEKDPESNGALFCKQRCFGLRCSGHYVSWVLQNSEFRRTEVSCPEHFVERGSVGPPVCSER
eukprot:2146092-Alexandrium_andersonii.AAC.1